MASVGLGSANIGVFLSPDGGGWRREAAAALSCVELGLQPGETCLPHAAMILSAQTAWKWRYLVST